MASIWFVFIFLLFMRTTIMEIYVLLVNVQWQHNRSINHFLHMCSPCQGGWVWLVASGDSCRLPLIGEQLWLRPWIAVGRLSTVEGRFMMVTSMNAIKNTSSEAMSETCQSAGSLRWCCHQPHYFGIWQYSLKCLLHTGDLLLWRRPQGTFVHWRQCWTGPGMVNFKCEIDEI